MSQRGKRQPNRSDDGPVVTKRRKCRPSAAAEEETASIVNDFSGSWTPRPLTDLKMPSIYNRSTTEAPAELFRKDLISAMKLPDSEPLATDEYWIITDQWKQEWERGVQVPVNPDSLPEPTVTVNHCATNDKAREFKLPKSKYIRLTKDENFTSESHFLSPTPAKAEKACAYDLDDCDAAWLAVLNGERALGGLPSVTDDQLERVMEELEVRCWEKVQTIVKAEEGLGIEYDENVICDVCRSPDSEEGNEMVFCDCCNICVHQACYGITTIPSGSWLCRTCALGQRPGCELCPNKGGAMKCTRSGQKWAHVSCALWIPEVSIGCVERMEPITKISSIPQSRWALVCVLCRERVGACIQCSVKTCKTAYHVTCAFKHGLEMRAIIEDENADDGVKLRSYCQKHSVTSKKERCGSQSEEDESKRRKRKDMTSEEKNQARAAKLHEIEAEFHKHVSVKDVTQPIDVDPEGIQYIYNYWKLKRKAGFNRPLLPPKSEDADMLSHQQEQADIEKMKMFVQLRQDLERVRNLCYMVSRREKLSRSFFRMREQTFHKQATVLGESTATPLKTKEVAAVIAANHGPSIYDRLYSQPSAAPVDNFELVLARIAGTTSPPPPPPDADKPQPRLDLNGLVKCPPAAAGGKADKNPYKRLYFNGAARRRSSLYGSMSSGSESDALRRSPNKKLLGLPDSASSSQEDEDDKKQARDKSVSGKAKTVVRKKSRKSVVAAARTKVDTTSEEDEKPPGKSAWQGPRSKSLRQMERELASATDDSDELVPIKVTTNEPQKRVAIYSDSDSEVSAKGDASEEDRNEDKSSTPGDQPFLRTKAAMKEFSAGMQAKGGGSEKAQKNNPKSAKSKKPKERELQDDSMDDDSTKDKENVKSSKKSDYVPSGMIVPQRQAAKKASESMRFSHGKNKDQVLVDQEAVKATSPLTPVTDEPKVKPRLKHKSRDLKEPRTPGKSNDIYDFEKETTSLDEAAEILAYVPQRQAAKKAALHIKSGMTKPVPGETDAKDLPDVTKPKKDADAGKQVKRESEGEKPTKQNVKSPDLKGKSLPRPVLSSSSSSSSSGDSLSLSSSDSDSDASKTKSPSKEKVIAGVEKKSSSLSPQKDSLVKRSKQVAGSKAGEDWPFLDKGDQSSRSSSSSSGSVSSDSDMFTRKKESSSSAQRKAKDADDRKGSSVSKLGGKKFKKAPDKKLKTSDRRPELEFQPPVTERDEPAKSKESPGKGRKPGDGKAARPDEGDRLGNADGRSRALAVSKGRVDDDDSSVVSDEAEADARDERGRRPSGGRNQSRAARAEEQSKRRGPAADLEGRRKGGRKVDLDAGKDEGRARKPGDPSGGGEGAHKPAKVRRETVGSGAGSGVPAGSNKSGKEARKSREEPAVPKKTDKKVGSLEDKKASDKIDRDNLATRIAKESEKSSLDRKSSRTSEKLFEIDSKTDKLLNKNIPAHDSASLLKTSPLKDDSSKLKHSVSNISRRKASPSREISSKKANKLVDLFEPEEVKRKEKLSGLNQDLTSTPDKRNSMSPHAQRLTNKELNQKTTTANRLSRQQDASNANPRKDRKAAVVEVPPAEKDVRRDSTESVASVSTEFGDDRSKRKGKAMPWCKKKELGMLADLDTSRGDRVDKDDTPVETQPNARSRKPSQNNTSKRGTSPDVAVTVACDPTPARNLPATPLDLDHHDFLVPDPESAEQPRKISSRTPSLTGPPPPYPQRSIFSPQQPKDPAAAELFDFENDILAVDETVNDDGFSMARDSEELMRPLTFSFSSDFLFKEESKEDSERGTLNLVEKLRLQYAQKSTSGQPEETPDVVDEEPPEEKHEPAAAETVAAEPTDAEVKEDDLGEVPAGRGPNSMESSADVKSLHAATPVQDPAAMEVQEVDKLEERPYSRADNYDGGYVPVEAAKASIPSLEKLDRTNSGQADERWVPPSVEFIQQQQQLQLQQQQQQQQQQHLHYESHVQLLETPAQSPYTDHRTRAKWADSEVLPVRRSSSSSGSSSSSSSHREDVDPPKRDDFIFPHNPVDLYAGLHPGMPSFPPCSLDIHSYHPYSEASQFVGPVSLFPPACDQLPFPSPGMYPAPLGPPFTTHQLARKPSQDELGHVPPPCSASFTSSSNNMALFTALVSQPPTPVPPPTPSPVSQPDLPHSVASFPPAATPESVPVSPIGNAAVNHNPGKDSPTPKATNASAGKKSPTKPTRTSARVTSQLSKSPGKSPRQLEPVVAKSPARVRDTGTKRGKAGVNRGANRGGGNRRGRGRGRGQNMHYQDMDYNTIHSKLAGTVYDLEFDDDSPTDSVESMRAMRERRRSTDVHGDRKPASDYESSLSPRFGSPSHQPYSSSKPRYNADVRDLRPPTPLSSVGTPARDEELMPPPSPLPVAAADRGVVEHFPEVVRPLLPGPVDMRTYNTLYEPSPANNPAAYHNHVLGQFATAVAEQHVTDFVEDFEKELHTALEASKTSSSVLEVTKETEIMTQVAIDNGHVSQMKVLSDSRNQLKVKIKGPVWDANYSTCSVPAFAQHQTPVPVPPLDVIATASNAIPIATTAVSSLRRMRKKELLRQYWSQDMNMIDPTGGAVVGQGIDAAPTAAHPPINRTIITIPKAVASMTTIPTREDYKAVVDANMEKKRRKEKVILSNSLISSVPRELRHLDLDPDDPGMPERRRSVGSTGSNASSVQDGLPGGVGKMLRRGRLTKPATDCPVLKIKISSGVVAKTDAIVALDEKKTKVGLRPPKKRLSSVPMPSMEDMKRESMKFRKQVIKDLKEEKKSKRSKPGGKKEKKKRHRDAQMEGGDSLHEVCMITDESAEKTSTPKLIIRFNKRPNTNSVGDGAAPAAERARIAAPPVVAESAETRPAMPPPEAVDAPTTVPSQPDPNKSATGLEVPNSGANGAKKGPSPLLKVRSSKVTPIRLKLARCNEGYMMKAQPADPLATDSPAAVPMNDSDQALKNSSSVLVNAGCEVR